MSRTPAAHPKPHRIPSFLRHVGPGVITGAADDDPSGIATYTQAGAQFGTGVLWTVFLTIPFMIGVKQKCEINPATISRVQVNRTPSNARTTQENATIVMTTNTAPTIQMPID